MVEEFIGIIAATIIVMRPCFYMLFHKIARFFLTYDETDKSLEVVHTNGPLKINNRSGHSSMSKRDCDRFNRIMVTTDIELQSRNRSTDQMLATERSS